MWIGNRQGRFIEVREEVERWESDFQDSVCKLLHYTDGPVALGHFGFPKLISETKKEWNTFLVVREAGHRICITF